MFCFKCGTRVADDAVFCLNCGNRITNEQPVAQEPVMQQPVAQTTVEQQMFQPTAQEQPVFQPTVQEQPVSQDTVVLNPSMQPMYTEQPVATPVQQPIYNQNQYVDQSQYVQHGAFQPAQNTYQPGYNQPYTQAFYNTPAQPVKREKTSAMAILFLFIASFVAIAISVGYFINGNVGLGVVNAVYFVVSIMLLCYCFSSKKSANVIKAVGYVLLLVMNVIFLGFSEIREAFTIFGSDNAMMTDYYYAIILILQYVFLYIYLVVSVIRGFTNKNETSYFACLCGYFALILIIAGAVVNIASDTPGAFVFNIIPIDLGIVCLLAGDLFATLRKGKNAAEAENN